MLRLLACVKDKRARSKPRILLLVDRRRWAYDNSARQIARHLRREFDFEIRYVWEQPDVDARDFDLIYVFFWGEDSYRRYGFHPNRIVKGLSSHRWEDNPTYGPCTPSELVTRYLDDACSVLCTSERLKKLIDQFHPRVYHTPNGYDPRLFWLSRKRTGPMVIGWAGDIQDPVKGLKEIIQPACEGRFQLQTALGGTPHHWMNIFYNKLDVFAVASTHEGEPLTLIEAMAAGCFPVCVDIGIVPELIRSGENGLIVPERTPEAFREAIAWCESHLDQVRAAGEENARKMLRERNWAICAPYFRRVFVETLEIARRPRFRNDDVSADSHLEHFREFCQIFRKYCLTQVHGVTLHGRTNMAFKFGDIGTEYEEVDSIAWIPNDRIRELSEGLDFESRRDLIDFLAEGPDEIALHGLYHTDYSKMTAEEQRRDIQAGLEILRRLFPRKPARYFIAPFNRTNEATYAVCKEFGLEVLAEAGVHLENELENLVIRPETWYRYHHHRFYPESLYDYCELSLEALDAAFKRNFGEQVIISEARSATGL